MTAPALRPVTPGDNAFLASVYASTRAGEMAIVPWSDEQKEAFVAQQFAAQSAHYATHYPHMSADVVVVDGEPAGRLLVDRWDREIRIVDISLLPAFRGRGIGSTLLQELMAEAAESERSLSIHVERNNAALRLYERLGFEPAGDEGVYLRMELASVGRGEDDGRARIALDV
jgi:ribosomal protein S18 acetylase RimI-like enzyme